jgi:hypothetical protein
LFLGSLPSDCLALSALPSTLSLPSTLRSQDRRAGRSAARSESFTSTSRLWSSTLSSDRRAGGEVRDEVRMNPHPETYKRHEVSACPEGKGRRALRTNKVSPIPKIPQLNLKFLPFLSIEITKHTNAESEFSHLDLDSS